MNARPDLWRRILAAGPALSLLTPVPSWADPPRQGLTLAEEVTAFKAKVSAARTQLYDEHKSLDLDKQLEELEKKASGNVKLFEELIALRSKIPPDFYKPKAVGDPKLLREVRWSEFVELRNAATDGKYPVFFKEHVTCRSFKPVFS